MALFSLCSPLLLAPFVAWTPIEVPGPSAPRSRNHPNDGPDCELIFALQPDRLVTRVKTNLVFFDLVAGAPRELEDELPEPEWEAHAAALEEYVREHLFLEVGSPAADYRRLTDFERTKFLVRPALESLLDLFPKNGAQAMIELELALEVLLDQPPTRLKIRWDEYPHDSALGLGDDAPLMEISGQLHDGRVDLPLLFRADEPEIIWHGEVTALSELFLEVPEVVEPQTRTLPALSLGLGILGLGVLAGGIAGARRGSPKWGPTALASVALLVGAGATRGIGRVPMPARASDQDLAPSEAQRIFETLHSNVYFAFEYEQESEVYDALARSVGGELLEDLYLQIYTSLILEEEGGAVARVQAVRHLSTEIEQIGVFGTERTPGFLTRARWQVDGKVSHFGHSHERTTEQLAQFTVREVEGEWRIVGDKILESRVLSAAPLPEDGLLFPDE